MIPIIVPTIKCQKRSNQFSLQFLRDHRDVSELLILSKTKTLVNHGQKSKKNKDEQ